MIAPRPDLRPRLGRPHSNLHPRSTCTVRVCRFFLLLINLTVLIHCSHPKPQVSLWSTPRYSRAQVSDTSAKDVERQTTDPPPNPGRNSVSDQPRFAGHRRSAIFDQADITTSPPALPLFLHSPVTTSSYISTTLFLTDSW